MTIDFEKCFDHIEHSAIRGALQYFNFGPYFIAWTMLLFNGLELCTQNNGHISEWFEPTHGVHQGCCYTPFLYILCGEILAHHIKSKASIEGIQICDHVHVIPQFADDTMIAVSF